MAEIIITEAGETLARLCDDLVNGIIAPRDFCDRVDSLLSDEFYGAVSEWESDNLLDDLQDPIGFYEPDSAIRHAESGLYDGKDFVEEIRKVYETYKKRLENVGASSTT